MAVGPRKLFPLSMPTDAECISLIQSSKEGSSESFEAIDSLYGDLFYKICHKYRIALERNGIPFDEVTEEKHNLLFKCVRSYDLSRGAKFSTWVANQTRYFCLNKLLKFKNQVKEDDFDFNTLSSPVKDSFVDAETLNGAESFIKELKDKRAIEVFKLRYGSEKKNTGWKSIGKKLHISSVTARKIHNKALSLIRAKIKTY